jgi:hypothetical protein
MGKCDRHKKQIWQYRIFLKTRADLETRNYILKPLNSMLGTRQWIGWQNGHLDLFLFIVGTKS